MNEQELIKEYFTRIGKKGGQGNRKKWATMTPEEREAATERNRQAGKKGGRAKKLTKESSLGILEKS